MAAKPGSMMPIVSKVYCSPSDVVLVVRRRPNVANGGGFVGADCSQRVVFSVDGCGILGRKEELILRDGEGNALLLGICPGNPEAMAAKPGSMMPIVSKVYCSPSDVVLVVRRRPNVANGGGFVGADCSQRVVFSVDGCGILGRKEELILRDGEGNALLLIRRKGGIVEAVSLARQWKGFTYDFLGSHKLVFTLKEPNSCFSTNSPIKISMESKECSNYRYFEVRGDFPEKHCSIVNSRGDIIALIGVKEIWEQVMTSRDWYHVEIKAGIDQAFIFGVVAVLDYIYDGSTGC